MVESPTDLQSMQDALNRLFKLADTRQLCIYLLKFEASVRLCAPWSQKALRAAATNISGVSGRWQLSR